MHQHPRPHPASASPANSEQTNPTRTNNPRDRDVQALSAASPLPPGSGSSEDFTQTRQDQPVADPAAQLQRLNQVVQNFHTKAALIILHSRFDLPPAYSAKTNEKRVNKWFNIELDETDGYLDDIKRWKRFDLQDERPPPLVIEIFLTVEPARPGQRLVILDDEQRRWDVLNALNADDRSQVRGKRRATDLGELLLERWTVELGEPPGAPPADLTTVLPLVYKKSIVLFRSLYTYCNFLPASKLSRKIGKGRSTLGLKLGFRIADGSRLEHLRRADNIATGLVPADRSVVSDYSFGVTDSPAGPFSVQVRYRDHCDFRIDDSEELLSSRFLGADDDLGSPSRPPGPGRPERPGAHRVGSLPTARPGHPPDAPDLGQVYGSLSTFHRPGVGSGTSPISALRAMKEPGDVSASPDEQRAPSAFGRAPSPPPSQPPRPGARVAPPGRRSSFSFQPFKAPALSASPKTSSPLASSPRPPRGPPALGSLTEESVLPPPPAPVVVARRSGPPAADPAAGPSTSSSPKPPAGSRFSSSFGHRKARLSAGGPVGKTDDDQTSSGKASAHSLVPPGSGLIAEPPGAGGSSGSMHDDDEHISDFLKMLDQKKDLLSAAGGATADASARRTAAALTRFHKMRESNAALSESLSSSTMLQRSSTSSSRQLSGVPPMVAATSTSTSSSPGKPVSPHTPHTPFAPSRLSAAYNYDDEDVPAQAAVRPAPVASSGAEEGATAPPVRSHTHVPAIDIPSSPRPVPPGDRRSSSAQRRPLSSDDVNDPYGTRSASMGAREG